MSMSAEITERELTKNCTLGNMQYFKDSTPDPGPEFLRQHLQFDFEM